MQECSVSQMTFSRAKCYQGPGQRYRKLAAGVGASDLIFDKRACKPANEPTIKRTNEESNEQMNNRMNNRTKNRKIQQTNEQSNE